ncbi:TC1A [Hepatospora eriocheir]|uniref:TC1A n=1 Tax=Hepatospora eriocheir TaxID=1081669 RepID=A0A1X0Q885_9MICR|nr:TC1A [Hepatospora eriocheir]
MKQFIKNLHNMNPFISSREIIEKLNKKFNLKVSRPTISRFLSSLELLTNLALKKPLLRPVNIKQRFEICKNFLGMKNETLKRIIFLDEVKINLFTSDGARYVRHYPGERHNSKKIVPTVKHGGGCVMVWGCISYQSVGRLVFIENIMTGAAYKQILAKNLR